MIGKPQKQEAEAGNLRKIKSNTEKLKKTIIYLTTNQFLLNIYDASFNYLTIGFAGTGHHGNI